MAFFALTTMAMINQNPPTPVNVNPFSETTAAAKESKATTMNAKPESKNLRILSPREDFADRPKASILAGDRCDAARVKRQKAFDTYFHDGNGVPLGYLEIRDTYRSGRVPRFRSITIPVEGQLMLAGRAFDGYDAWSREARTCSCALLPVNAK